MSGPSIDEKVDIKIDEKIETAQLPEAVSLDTAKALAAKTTEEEQRKASGQRFTSAIWEVTQAIIAITITLAVIYAALRGIESEILNTAFVLVLTMYLVRTNHTKIGGVGGTDSR